MLRFFGKYSYGFYILHVILLTALLPALRTVLRNLTQSKGVAVFGAGMIVFILSTLASVLTYQLFEAPFLRLKRHFEFVPAARPNLVERAAQHLARIHLIH